MNHPTQEQVWNAFAMGFCSEYGRKPVIGVDCVEETIDRLMELVTEKGATPNQIIGLGKYNGKTLKEHLLQGVEENKLVFAKKRK